MIKKIFHRCQGYMFFRYGQNLLRQQKPEKALAFLEASIHCRPTSAYGYLYLALTLAELRRFAEAQAAMQRALELRGEDAIFLLMLGRILCDAGDFAQAYTFLARSLKSDPTNPLSHGYLALASLGNGDPLGCQKILQEKGCSENTEFQLRLILALENHLLQSSVHH